LILNLVSFVYNLLAFNHHMISIFSVSLCNKLVFYIGKKNFNKQIKLYIFHLYFINHFTLFQLTSFRLLHFTSHYSINIITSIIIYLSSSSFRVYYYHNFAITLYQSPFIIIIRVYYHYHFVFCLSS